MRVMPKARPSSAAPSPSVPLMPSMSIDCPATAIRFLHGAVGCAEIAEARGLLEADIIGQLDQRILRRSHEFAEAAIGIKIVDLLRVRPEAEIAIECEIAAAR